MSNLAEIRTRVLTESLEDSNNPKFGYFGFPGPLCIGDDSYAPRLVRKAKSESDDGEPIRNIQTSPLKKGFHPNVFFSFAPPMCLDDPYQDPHKATKKGRVTMLDPDAAFKPPGKVKESVNKLGYAYEYHMDGVKDPKAVKEALAGVLPLRQIYTNPSKKGGGGLLTQGVLFGFGEERKLPEFIADDFDAAKKMRKKELDEHHELLEGRHPGVHFRSMAYGNNNFGNNSDTFGYDVPTHVPRDPDKRDMVPESLKERGAFVPANPMKKGMLKGLLGDFPGHMPDPVPQAPPRQPKSDDERAAFRLGCPVKVPKPTPSVTTLTRNMRSERPSSFARPLL
jgi:hypothetical protein